MVNNTPSSPATPPAPAAKHSIGARLLVAGAFSSIGAKIGTIGTVMDANALYSAEKVGIGQKLKETVNGTLIRRTIDKFNMLVDVEKISHIKAANQVAKWTIITTVAGTAAGAAVGWIQGGRIENWKDIFKHPWESTKIIFGAPTKSEMAVAGATKTEPQAATAHQSAEPSKQWTDSIKPRVNAASHAEAIEAEKPALGQVLGS